MANPSTTLKVLPKNNNYMLRALGLCLGLFGLLVVVFWERMMNRLAVNYLTLRPNSLAYDLWQSPPANLSLNVYLFNWTNPQDFHNHSIKPIFQEVGPYHFTDHQTKVNIRWHPENASVSYQKKSDYQFVPEKSNASLKDPIISINGLAAVFPGLTKHWSYFRRSIADMALGMYHNDISVKRTADEFLFAGYEDTILSFSNIMPSSLSGAGAIPFDRLGYAYKRNGSADYYGDFNLFTGQDDIAKIGRMHTYKYQNTSTGFTTQCYNITGSGGEFQKPFLTKNDEVSYFVPDFCRSVAMDYLETVKIDGISANKYIGSLKSLDNGTLNPENSCYCNGDCLPAGVMNLTSCWYGFPLYASYPHFYNADPSYVEALEGVTPLKEKHELSVILEPRSGLLMQLTARAQFNIFVQPSPHLRMFRKMRKIMMPILWVEQLASAPPKIMTIFQTIPIVILSGQILGILCCILGLILMLWQPLIKCRSLYFVRKIELNDFDDEMSPDVGKSDIKYTTDNNKSEVLTSLLRPHSNKVQS